MPSKGPAFSAVPGFGSNSLPRDTMAPSLSLFIALAAATMGAASTSPMMASGQDLDVPARPPARSLDPGLASPGRMNMTEAEAECFAESTNTVTAYEIFGMCPAEHLPWLAKPPSRNNTHCNACCALRERGPVGGHLNEAAAAHDLRTPARAASACAR